MNDKTLKIDPATTEAIAKAAAGALGDPQLAAVSAAASAVLGKPAAKEASGVTKRSSAYNIDPKRVTLREGWNARFDLGDIEALASSIKTELARDPSNGGLLHDLRVKRIQKTDPRSASFDFEVIDGERRFTAIQLCLKQGVVFPDGVGAKIVDKSQDDLTSLVQMFTANTGKAFLPLEEAAAYKRMREGGMTIKQICAACGKGAPQVSAALALLDADQELQDAVKSGAISGTNAKAIAVSAKGDKAAQRALVADAKAAKGKGAAAKAAKSGLAARLQQTRVAKAAKKGKTLKMRALDDEQLKELGMKVAKMLDAKAREAKQEYDPKDVGSLLAIVKKDDMLALAFTLGACEALKAAAGVKVNLDI